MNLFTMLLISAKKISNLLWSFVTNEIPNQPTENFTEVGDITESENTVFTNFSGSNYLYFNNLDLSNSIWEKHLKIKTGNDIDSWQTVYSLGTEDQRGDMLCIYESKFGLVVSYSGSYWNIEEYNSSYTLSTNTIYYVKVKFDGESYKIDLSIDGETYSNILTYSSSTNISVYPIRFNIGWRAYSPSSLYFRGTAYLQDWKIYKSGSLVWSGYSMPLNVGDAIKLNEGLGYANYKWNAYPSTTSTVNDFTVNNTIKQISTDGEGNRIYAIDDPIVSTNNVVFNTGTLYDCYTNGTNDVYAQHGDLEIGDDYRVILNGFNSGPGWTNFSTSGKLIGYLDKTYDSVSSFEMVFHIFTGSSFRDYERIINWQNSGNYYDSTYGPYLQLNSSNLILCWYNDDGNYTSISVLDGSLSSGAPKTNTWYWVKFTYDGTDWKSYISYDESLTWTLINTQTPSYSLFFKSTGFDIGRRAGGGDDQTIFNGTIDLANLSFIINGDTAFDGSTAVLDTNYSIDGNPVYVENSNCYGGGGSGKSIYINNINYPNYNTWEILFKIKLEDIRSGAILYNREATYYSPLIGLKDNGQIWLSLSSNGYNWDISSQSTASSSSTLSANTWYWLKLVFTGTYYNLYISTTGAFSGEEELYISVQSSEKLYYVDTYISLFNEGTASWYTLGSLDLSNSYIKLDSITNQLGYAKVISQFYEKTSSTSVSPISVNALLNMQNQLVISNSIYNKDISKDVVTPLDYGEIYIDSTDGNSEITLISDQNNSEIKSSSYLTQKQKMIDKSKYFTFDLEYLNGYNTTVIISGKPYSSYELPAYFTNDMMIELIMKKSDDETQLYSKLFKISQDWFQKKIELHLDLDTIADKITVNVNGSCIWEDVNLDTFVLDVYQNDTIYYKIEKEGYETLVGLYKVVDNPFLSSSKHILLNMTRVYKYTFNTTPNDATIELSSGNIYKKGDNWIQVYSGSSIEYKIFKDGYITQTGMYNNISSDNTINISLTQISTSSIVAYKDSERNIANNDCTIYKDSNDHYIASGENSNIAYAKYNHLINQGLLPLDIAKSWEIRTAYRYMGGGNSALIFGSYKDNWHNAGLNFYCNNDKFKMDFAVNADYYNFSDQVSNSFVPELGYEYKFKVGQIIEDNTWNSNSGGGTKSTVYIDAWKSDRNTTENPKLTSNGTMGAGSSLPSEYKELTYIESTGTQYINTGLYANVGYRVKVKFYTSDNSISDQTIVGGNERSVIYIGSNFSSNFESFYRRYRSTWYDAPLHVLTLNTMYEVESIIRNRDQKLYINGSLEFQETVSASSSNTTPLRIFNRSGNTNYAQIKLYELKIYDVNDDLIRNFVPCKRISDNVLGLYDTVNNVFHVNSGSGSFNAGDEVGYACESSDNNPNAYLMINGESGIQNPLLTSNGTMGGSSNACTASHQSQPAWWAFDGDLTSSERCWWTSHGVTSVSNPCWITYYYPTAIVPEKVIFINEVSTPSSGKTGVIQGSNDNSNWTDLADINIPNNNSGYRTTINISTNNSYKYIRCYFTASYDSGGVSFQEIQIYQAPIGLPLPTTQDPVWLTYYTPTAIKPRSFTVINDNTYNNIKNAIIEGSTDNSTWDTLYTITDRGQQKNLLEKYSVNTDNKYKYFRLKVTETYSNYQQVNREYFIENNTQLTVSLADSFFKSCLYQSCDNGSAEFKYVVNSSDAIVLDDLNGTPYDLYLRGTINGWDTDPNYQFKYDSNYNAYYLDNVTWSGEYKFASSDWSTIDLGSNGTSTIPFNSDYTLSRYGSDLNYDSEVTARRILLDPSTRVVKIITSNYIEPGGSSGGESGDEDYPSGWSLNKNSVEISNYLNITGTPESGNSIMVYWNSKVDTVATTSTNIKQFIIDGFPFTYTGDYTRIFTNIKDAKQYNIVNGELVLNSNYVENKNPYVGGMMSFLGSTLDSSNSYSLGHIDLNETMCYINGNLYWSAVKQFNVGDIVALNRSYGLNNNEWNVNNVNTEMTGDLTKLAEIDSINNDQISVTPIYQLTQYTESFNIDQNDANINTEFELPTKSVVFNIVDNNGNNIDGASISLNTYASKFNSPDLMDNYRIFYVEQIHGQEIVFNINNQRFVLNNSNPVLYQKVALKSLPKNIPSSYSYRITENNSLIQECETKNIENKNFIMLAHRFKIKVTNTTGCTITYTIGEKSYVTLDGYIECYSGQTVNYVVEKSGYTTEQGSYTIPYEYVLNREYSVSLTLE